MNVPSTHACHYRQPGSTLWLQRIAMLLCCFLLLSLCSSAQPLQRPHQPVRIDPRLDKLDYQGFTIRLIPTPQGYYGYEIRKGAKLVQHEENSPQPDKPLEKRDEAFAAAKQTVDTYLKTGKLPSANTVGRRGHPLPLLPTAKPVKP